MDPTTGTARVPNGNHAAAAPQFAVPKPLYSQVRDLLAAQIAGGELNAGSVLPNETVLAQRFGVSVGTIRRAVEGLEDMGIVIRRQGRGTFVAGLAQSAADRFHRLTGPTGAALRISRKVLQVQRRPPTPPELLLLGIDTPIEAIEVVSTVVSARAIIGIERSVLSTALSPAIEQALDGGGDVYAALAGAGVLVARADDRISATAASEDDAWILSVPAGVPMLQLERRLFTVTGLLAEMSVGRYLSGAVAYEATSCNSG